VSSKKPLVCPACRRPARTRPLPPEGFWQEQVLQRIGMYPYRCEACGVRFYRKVPVGKGLGEARYTTPPRGPAPSRGPAPPNSYIPKVVAPPEATGDALTHEDFVDLIDHISRSEERKGLKATGDDEES
jgi:hypothetical protein